MAVLKVTIPDPDRDEIAEGARRLSLSVSAFVRLAALEKARGDAPKPLPPLLSERKEAAKAEKQARALAAHNADVERVRETDPLAHNHYMQMTGHLNDVSRAIYGPGSLIDAIDFAARRRAEDQAYMDQLAEEAHRPVRYTGGDADDDGPTDDDQDDTQEEG